MKAKDVIKYMKEYKPEDEMLVMWWDADSLYNDDDPVTNEEWNKIIDKTDGYGFDEVHTDVCETLNGILFSVRYGEIK